MATEKKILDGEFRNGLFKSLIEAGYEKDEATKIVGTKYFACLKGETINTLQEMINRIATEDFTVIDKVGQVTDYVKELTKLKEIFTKKEKTD